MIRQVTIANLGGMMVSCWIPADAAAAVNDLIDINDEPFIVMALYPPVETPDNRLPCPQAKPWQDPT